ncbi:hypothetical protein B0H34DRAFT_801761 [Crassisporium funariophilum]|nr:hypothetical protein B0H34DRAFT_801761 [Crassisporium funariophilum]
MGQERYELEAESLETVLKIQIDTRVREADTPEKLAAIFFAICHSGPCTAKNEHGQLCRGVPKLVKYNNPTGRSHKYFVSCNGWSSRFSDGHRTAYIPSGVKDKHLEILFRGGILPGFEHPFPCGRIVAAHIGLRVLNCTFPHIGDGSQARLVHHYCPASRTIYIPNDPTIRMAIVVPDHEEAHNHPILPPTKTPVAIKEIYKQCIQNAGLVGSSVRTVDNARSTKLTLGTSPSLYAPTLQNNRIKQDILRGEKKKTYPFGTGLPGVVHLMNEDLKKPINERYIHGITTTITGGQVLLTANPYLLSRIHKAKTLFVDTTFKRTVGALKEWEVVMYDKQVERAVTIARVYSDRADRLQYKTIFDELQRVTLQLTARPLHLKRLSKDGTLISIGVDMELAQALGAGDSFLPTNEPEFSNIRVETAEEIIEYFIRACYTHAKRGVHDLKPYVTDNEYQRLSNFMYLKSKQEVEEFSAWVKGLNIPKVQAWWDHKVNNSWILPSLIKCLSKMNSNDWDLTPPTTNVGESQHHWTNINTGIMLSLLEALLTARELDNKVAAEIKAALETGVLKNHRNDTYTRLARNTTRTTHASKKAREGRQQKKALNVVETELASLKESQKENAAKIKALKASKSTIAGKGKSSKAESNSSGKAAVTGVSERKRAKTAARVSLKKDATPSRTFLSLKPTEFVDMPGVTESVDMPGVDYLQTVGDEVNNAATNHAMSENYLEARQEGYAPSTSLMGVVAGQHHFSIDVNDSLPFTDTTAANNLFPQTHDAGLFMGQYDTSTNVDSHAGSETGADLFALASYNISNAARDDLAPADDHGIDYLSSDILDHFLETFGSLDGNF